MDIAYFCTLEYTFVAIPDSDETPPGYNSVGVTSLMGWLFLIFAFHSTALQHFLQHAYKQMHSTPQVINLM